MNYIRVKVKLIILLSLALIIVPILLISNQRDFEVFFDEKINNEDDDPRSPRVSTVYHEDTNGNAYKVYMSGDYAYIADNSGLAVINISDPTNPETPVNESTNGGARSVYVSGDYAYVADGAYGLAVINISDPC